MSHPWEKEYMPFGSKPYMSFRRRVKRKIKTGMFAISLVTMCYLAVAKHAVKTTNSVK